MDASGKGVGDVWPLICFGPIRRIFVSIRVSRTWRLILKGKLYFRFSSLTVFVVFCYSYLVNFNNF